MGLGDVSVEYLSTGANRQTAVADWSSTGILAFGADSNVAIWRPKVRKDPTFKLESSNDKADSRIRINLKRELPLY